MRGRRGCRQPQQVLPNRVRLLPNWPCFQRCLPLHGLAPDRAPAPDRDRARDEAVPKETKKQSLRLGVLSGLTILNGYPGESSGDASTRWTYWTLSMLPFCYIVYTLFYGLKESQDAQPECVRDQVKW